MHHAILILFVNILLVVCFIALGVFLVWAHDLVLLGSLLFGALSHGG